ncbi:MAG: type II secretion system F family protein, partial [Actinomycetota bacterium]|nr:type II secretion system F family protein [Actinomycetota bacterium]
MSELMQHGVFGIFLVLLVTVSATALVSSIGFLVVDRSSLRTKLRDLDELYKLVDVRDQELVLPFADRVAAPVLKGLSKLGWRFSPAGRVDQIRVMLRRAGRPEADTDRYLAVRVLTTLVAPFAAYGTWLLTSSQGPMVRLACTGLAAACCTILPSRKLRSQVEGREHVILRQLPDIMDLLVICMEAGLGFTSAVARTVANIDGEMSREFALVLAEMRAGSTRGDALGGLAERVQLPQVRSFVSAIRQADQFGVSVSSVLRGQAEEMRIFRKQVAQEKAMKAPVKMLMPMVFLIFPPMFVVVLGPAALSMG